MLCTIFIKMLGGCYVFYFYFYFDQPSPDPNMENKITYYKICDIKYGISFLFHEVFCLKL